MEWEYLDKDYLLFRNHADGNIYEVIYEFEDTDVSWVVAVLKEIGSDRKVLRLPPDDPGAQFHLWVNGIDLYEVNENVREIVLENRSGFIGSNHTLPHNFIKDPKKLPNLKEIRAITRDHSGKCLTNIWIKGWDKRNVPYLIRQDGMVYAIKDSIRGTVSTRRGCNYGGGYNLEGDLVLHEKVFDGEKEYTLEEIAGYSFLGNQIRSVSIPPSVKSIERGAFMFCLDLERVQLSEGLEEIDDDAFKRCDKLKEIILPDSLVRIGYDAFPYDIEHVRLPASARFDSLECESLTIPSKYDPAILDELVYYYPKEFLVEADCDTLRAVDGVLYDKDMKELLVYPPRKEDEVFTVPESVKSISEKAFRRFSYLRELRIPSSVRKIPSSLKNISELRVTRIKKKPGTQEES